MYTVLTCTMVYYAMQPFVMSTTPTKRRIDIRDGTVAKIKCTDFIKVCTKLHAFTTKSTILECNSAICNECHAHLT